MASSLESGVGPAATIDGKGKVAVGSVHAREEEASLSLVTRGMRMVALSSPSLPSPCMVVVVATAAVVASVSACEVAAAARDASPVEAIRMRHRGMVVGVLALGFGSANVRRESMCARKCARWKKVQ